MIMIMELSTMCLLPFNCRDKDISHTLMLVVHTLLRFLIPVLMLTSQKF